MKVETEACSNIPEQKNSHVHHSQSRLKKSFEGYYQEKHLKELNLPCPKSKETNFCFRDILTEMNGRVNSIKKYRYRP